MQRPRWHDALIVAAITGFLVLGVWALWWDDVRRFLNLGPDADPTGPAPVATGRT
jgi:hypothetical protein